MSGERKEKVEELVRRLAADFFERESNRDSLISITRVDLTPDLKRAVILISVLPESKEKAVLDFAMRMRTPLREYIKKNVSTRVVPHIEVQLDMGEKHRQKIDNILR
jgi:ribosome-binding factor A